MATLLIVAASPLGQDRLRVGHEVKKVKQALERSRNRDQWTIESNESATVDDLRRALLDFRPTVLHFSGHGGGVGGLAFEDEDGETHAAQAQPLTKLLHHFKDTLKCVVLNACYSETQAVAIRQQIDYVIGMSRTIADEAAIQFAVAFYDAVFAGTTFRQAFDIGCTALDLGNLPDQDVPIFLTTPHLGGTVLPYTALIPQIEDVLLAYANTPYEERYRFTTKGDRIADAMRRYYGERLHALVDKVTLLSTRRIDEEHWQVRAAVTVKDEKVGTQYYLRIRDRTVQIEWEASVGYWSTPPKTYLALGTSEPIVARVRAQIGTYYHGYFSDKGAEYQSINLTSQSNDHLIGYVRRHSAAGKELIDLLSDGNQHELTLGIGNVDKKTEHVVIDAFLSHSWLLPDSESV